MTTDHSFSGLGTRTHRAALLSPRGQLLSRVRSSALLAKLAALRDSHESAGSSARPGRASHVARLVTVLALLAFTFCSSAQNRERPRTRRSESVVPMKEVRVTSPNGRVTFTVLGNPERLTFEVTRDGQTVIEPSPIIMKLDGYDLSSGVVFSNLETYQVNETYPWHGAHSTATNRCNGVRIALQDYLSSVNYTLEIRAYNDGVAFRHIIPGDANASRVPDEYTTFVIPAGATAWYGGLAGGHYEFTYTRKDISEVKPGEWAGPPLTLKLPGGAGYASITEADLVDYPGMGLEADGRRGWIVGLGHRQPLNWPFELRYGREEGKRLGKPAAISGTITTPWRVIMIGPDLNTLVNSTIVPSLCPPPDPKYFANGIESDWVHPGRAVWRYVDGGPEGLDGIKEFSKLAGELGFKYQVVEGVWNRWTMAQRKDVADYSRQQGVELFFWEHSRELRTPEAREKFFKMLHDLGVAGAKIDFFDSEAKEVVDVYTDLLKTAAKYHILLIFHGADKPTGLARTWPNEMVREAVKGMESRALHDRARHQAILPFTRLLAGPADYTTMIFNERRADTSWANQIASMAIFSAPVLTIAANPENILKNPAVGVIKSIPPVWDETIVLPQSEIGGLAAFARRTGDTWFVAVMCGPDAKSFDVPLTFLGDGEYRAELVRDGNTADSVKLESATMRKSDSLHLDLKAGGGFIGRFSRNK